MASTKFIVQCLHYNASECVLFMMEESDFRFNTPNYQTLTSGQLKSLRVRVNGQSRKVIVFRGDDGKDYAVYPDWSVKVVN